jgi:hypothetical protein
MVVAYMSLGKPKAGIDDANIFLVYGRNLAQGHGFVYNIGGERVEGFSSILWVLIIAGVSLLTGRPEMWLMILNAAIIAAALTVLTGWLDERAGPAVHGRDRSGRLLTLPSRLMWIWIFAVPGYLCWTTHALMETGLWSALLICASVITLDVFETGRFSKWRRAHMAWLIPALILTRPDGMAWAFIFLLLWFFGAFAETDRFRAAFGRIIPPFAAFLFSISALFIFRLSVFGFPFPNTYYAKVSPDKLYNLTTGLVYFLRFFASNGLIPLLALAAGAGLLLLIRFIIKPRGSKLNSFLRKNGAYIAISFILFIGMSIPIAMGGDHFSQYRFFQPFWPLLIVPAFFVFGNFQEWVQLRPPLASWLNRWKTWLLIPVFALVAFGNSLPWYRLDGSGLAFEFRIAEIGRKTGQFLNRLFESTQRPEVGEVVVGGIKYAYEGVIVDLMGLNNIRMAHSPGSRKGYKNHAAFNKDVFFEQRPDLIVPKLVAPEVRTNIIDNPWYEGLLRGLLHDGRFEILYEPVTIRRIDAADPERLFAYFRKDYLSELRRSGLYEISVLEGR